MFIDIFAGIEDKENFHGKPVGGTAESVINAIKGRIANPGPHGLCVATPTATVPDVDLSKARITEPLPYQLGQKVTTILMLKILHPYITIHTFT